MKSRVIGSCTSTCQSSFNAPCTWPTSYKSTSSDASINLTLGSFKCSATQLVSTSASGCAYPDAALAAEVAVSVPDILKFLHTNRLDSIHKPVLLERVREQDHGQRTLRCLVYREQRLSDLYSTPQVGIRQVIFPLKWMGSGWER